MAQRGAFSFFDSLRTTASQTHQIMIIVIGYDRSSKFFLSGSLSGTHFLNLLFRAEGHKISILSFHLKISKEKLLQWHQGRKYPSMNFARKVKTCREGFIPEINMAFLSPSWDTGRMDNAFLKVVITARLRPKDLPCACLFPTISWSHAVRTD